MDDYEIDDYIIKPKKFTINNSYIHGITQKKAQKDGFRLGKLLNNEGLGYAIQNCDILIGHNVIFDLNILMSEVHRIKFKNTLKCLKDIYDKERYICTKVNGKNVCKLHGFSGDYKYPKLEELYEHYYNDLDKMKLHNSKYDVEYLL